MNELLAKLIAKDETPKPVPCDVNGLTVFMRKLNAGEQVAVLTAPESELGFHAVLMCCCDGQGNKLFSNVGEVKARSPELVRKLVDEAFGVNGFRSKEVADDAKKDSAGTTG